MKNKPFILGIILILLLSSLSPTVIGLDKEEVDAPIQSVYDPMDSPWPMKCQIV